MIKFAPLTHVLWCATCKQGRYTWRRVDTPESWHTVCLIFGSERTQKRVLTTILSRPTSWPKVHLLCFKELEPKFWISFENILFQILLFQGYGPSCGEALGHGVSNADKAEIIRVHNELRAKIALGQESFGKPGPQPPASDMETIVSFIQLSK